MPPPPDLAFESLGLNLTMPIAQVPDMRVFILCLTSFGGKPIIPLALAVFSALGREEKPVSTDRDLPQTSCWQQEDVRPDGHRQKGAGEGRWQYLTCK